MVIYLIKTGGKDSSNFVKNVIYAFLTNPLAKHLLCRFYYLFLRFLNYFSDN